MPVNQNALETLGIVFYFMTILVQTFTRQCGGKSSEIYLPNGKSTRIWRLAGVNFVPCPWVFRTPSLCHYGYLKLPALEQKMQTAVCQANVVTSVSELWALILNNPNS